MGTCKDPVVIGFGPAGMFAALELIELGYRPKVFERGRRLDERSNDILTFIRSAVLDPFSNIQFGEGGAGAYSDGKIFSRPENSPEASKVLDTLIKFGAPPDIASRKKPHLGTDVLCCIVRNIREYILSKGGEISFSSQMTDIIVSEGRAAGVVIGNGKEFLSDKVFLALGHSARDSFDMLYSRQIRMEQKPIMVGLRIEHPREVIDKMRGEPSSTYSFLFNDRAEGRRVMTFCMCPGGEIVNASSENGHLVLNGMSYSARNSRYSNSAVVVTCKTSDYGSDHPLAGIEFQRGIEKSAFIAGGSSWKAPAQNMEDFLCGRVSGALTENSLKTGVSPFDLNKLFPGFISLYLKKAFLTWKEGYPDFVSDKALLVGAETRAACPVRFIRNEKYEASGIRGTFPIGEGSGHAGGITSSAVDAIKAVRAACSA